jgi:alkylhydroperoxidase family enzyme
MGGSPQLLESYQRAHELFMETSFTADEQTVVWQTINVEHQCNYCVPAHTAVANAMGVEQSITDALRNKSPLPEKLEALRQFTLKVIRQRGAVEEDDINGFLTAGYSRQNIMEVILALSQKVMSNYLNKMTKTPLDPEFTPFAWQP